MAQAHERTQSERVLDAARRCIARVGVAKTTVDDVAREAGLSRATVYRLFSGKPELLVALVEREIAGVEARLLAAVDRGAPLADQLTQLIVAAQRELASHDALVTVLTHEPELVMPYLTLDGAGVTLARAGRFLAPLLAPHVGAERAERAGEWVARTAFTYLCDPSPYVDLFDPASVRRLVVDFLEPSLVAVAASQSKG
jgi:AcrR family transcriptional regulator